MINYKIVFLLLSIFTFLRSYGISGGDIGHTLSLPSSIQSSEIIDGISYSVPIDLVEHENKLKGMPSYAKGKQIDETLGSYRKSKDNSVDLVGFKAETDNYGQLKAILEANNGSEIDSLVVVGPMNKDDFKAIWDCAVYGNMQVLNLENATIENNVIPDYAMYDPIQFETGFWLKIRRIILPEGVVSIGKAAFPFMGIEEINIPSTVREIGSTAFGYDRWLNCELVIPEGVEEIKYQTFNECNRLTMAPTLPVSLKKIGEHAFSMTRFDNLIFPDNLKEISQGAFQNTALSHVSIPETCLTIGPMAFQLCWALDEIILPENLENIPNGLFSMCDGLENLIINKKCRHIEDNAFMWCVKLKNVSFNQDLESIGEYAFDGCALTIINLPPSLKQLGSSCFGAMASTLHYVKCAAETPPICESDPSNPNYKPFSLPNENELLTLYIPVGTYNAYNDTWGKWDCFTNIIETDDFPPAGIYNVIHDEINQDNITYDLLGRKVETLTSGKIYIRNGQKFIVK